MVLYRTQIFSAGTAGPGNSLCCVSHFWGKGDSWDAFIGKSTVMGCQDSDFPSLSICDRYDVRVLGLKLIVTINSLWLSEVS
ncbi:hypothetical protein [Nostoc sp.]|uniref:hypothetical protein n=1 Tax=Nostoc sp. TaxID=1180 RepID=UPI002FFD38E4